MPVVCRLGFRQEAFTLGALASQFPRTADGFSFLAGFPFGRLLEMVAALHLPEETFALHLLLERFQRLIDVVIADHDLNYLKLSIGYPDRLPGVSLERLKRRKGRKRSLLRIRWPVRRVIYRQLSWKPYGKP